MTNWAAEIIIFLFIFATWTVICIGRLLIIIWNESRIHMMYLLFIKWWRVILQVRFLDFVIIYWWSFYWIYIALWTFIFFIFIIILYINLIIVQSHSTFWIFIHSSNSTWAMSNNLSILLSKYSRITTITIIWYTPFCNKLNLSDFIINSFISIKYTIFQKCKTVSQFFY